MTSWVAFARRRAQAARSLLLVLLALVTVATGLTAGSLGQSAALATDAARSALAGGTSGDAGLSVRTRLGDDAAAQDEAARAALAEGFEPAPITIYTSYASEPQAATGPDGKLAARLILAAGPLFDDGLRLVDGTWPADAGEAALQAGSAATLGLALGDQLTISGQALRLVATWEPSDPADPRWLGDALVTSGADDTGAGPLLVDQSVLAATGSPFIEWHVLPDAARITPAMLTTLADGAARAKQLASAADATGRGVTVSGDLGPAAAQAVTDRAVGDAFRLVPLSVLLLVALVGLVQVAGLLATARESEVGLLLARGASRRQVVAANVAEALIVAVLGSALGALLAVGALWAITGTLAQTGTVLLGAALGLALAAAALGGVAIRSAVHASRDNRLGTDRLRAVAGTASLALIVALAGLALWQLRRLGRFLSVADGVVTTDFVAALAPALLLAAAAIAALVLLAPLTRLLELITRRAGVATWLAGAHVARALRLHAVPVVLAVLATASATFATVFGGTADQLQRDLATLSAGAPVRATLSTAPGDFETPWSLPTADGLTDATPVWRSDVGQVGNLNVPMLAAPTSTLRSVAVLPDDEATPDLTEAAPASPVDLVVPAGAKSLDVAIAAEGTSTTGDTLTVSVTLRDVATGQAATVRAGAVELKGVATGSGSVALPGTSELAVDSVSVDAYGGDLTTGALKVTVSLSTADGELASLDAASLANEDDWGGTTELLPAPEATRVPVALTDATAEATSLKVGDQVTLTGFGRRFDATVAAVVPELPSLSTGEGVLADSAALARALAATGSILDRPGELWASTDAVDAARAALSTQPGVTAIVRPAANPQQGPTAVATQSLLAAAVGALVLATAGLAAASATSLRTRRSEVAVLRAIGMSPRAQARARTIESGAILLLAAAAGVAGGWGISALVAGPLAHSTGAESARHVALVVDWPPLLILLALGGAAVAVILALVARAVRRQALDSEYREEVR